MDNSTIHFKIVKLEAEVATPVSLQWQGKQMDAGPITVELDETALPTANQGTLNYERRRACADFHVRLSFPELAGTLQSLGLRDELMQPLHAIIHSEGDIHDDHSFALSGACDLTPHRLFTQAETSASVLPGL